jgi:hypothetical protein
LRLTALPPRPAIGHDFASRLKLPDPSDCARALQGSTFAQEITELAEEIRAHRFPIFGRTVDTGPEIAWRRDYIRGIETGLVYFRRIPFLDTSRAGDHKIIWELNRHQHLVVLAQAYLLTGDTRNLDEICAQLESWMTANPFHRGTNWASALEVAFRALSWIWIDHLVGRSMPAPFHTRWVHMLYLHGCHLGNNFSVYFAPNNHLIGEALALHALGLYFEGLPRADSWERQGAQVMREQFARQIRDDGSTFEQATYYQVYVLDMFLLHAILTRSDAEHLAKLERMADYLHAVTGPSRLQPFLGDDDGGRLFHPSGLREHFPRASIATAGAFFKRTDWAYDADDLASQAVWWLGADVLSRKGAVGKWESRVFPDAGVVVMAHGDTHALIDAGPFGGRRAGHSHSDTLSIVLGSGGSEILIDSGTYTYTGEPKWRDWFRGTEAHNTIRIDGRDQAVLGRPFEWIGRPDVKILNWQTNGERDILEAECSYDGFTHRRRVEFQKPDIFLITDDVSGPPGLHDVEQLWHPGSMQARAKLILPEDAELTESWRSTMFGEKYPSPMLRVRRRSELPLRLEARIELNR